MPNSLRCKISKLVYHGTLTQKDGERIRDALETKIAMKPELKDNGHRACSRCGFDLSYECVNLRNEKIVADMDYWNYCPICSQKQDWSNGDD